MSTFKVGKIIGDDEIAYLYKDEPGSLVDIAKLPPDGGPQAYYDLPVGAVTLNDLIEHKSYNQWHGDTAHLFNIFKAAWRWGIKAGTSKEYDARKFIYSGARLLMHYAGVKELRATLQRMLDDPQFKEKD